MNSNDKKSLRLSRETVKRLSIRTGVQAGAATGFVTQNTVCNDTATLYCGPSGHKTIP